MDETMNNITFVNSTSTTTDGTVNFTTNWDSTYQELPWFPYHYTKYTPKWHITQGYKNQIESMWD